MTDHPRILTEAYCNGWMAHSNGVTIEENPYDEMKQEVSRKLWCTGWTIRFYAVKHETLLPEHDDEVDNWGRYE
jgi:hypothetical protein